MADHLTTTARYRSWCFPLQFLLLPLRHIELVERARAGVKFAALALSISNQTVWVHIFVAARPNGLLVGGSELAGRSRRAASQHAHRDQRRNACWSTRRVIMGDFHSSNCSQRGDLPSTAHGQARLRDKSGIFHVPDKL